MYPKVLLDIKQTYTFVPCFSNQKLEKMKRTVILLLLYVLYYLVAHGQSMAVESAMLKEVVVKSYAPPSLLTTSKCLCPIHVQSGKEQIQRHWRWRGREEKNVKAHE